MNNEKNSLRKFAEWIVSLDDDDPESPGRVDRKTVTLNQIVERARKALEDESVSDTAAATITREYREAVEKVRQSCPPDVLAVLGLTVTDREVTK